MHNQPQLEQQIHAFRHKNYLLQNSDGNVDLYDATDKMEQEYREFRKNPLVAEYLAAENAFCRVVQKVNWTLIEELDFEVVERTNPDLAKGERKVVQAGVKGQQREFCCGLCP